MSLVKLIYKYKYVYGVDPITAQGQMSGDNPTLPQGNYTYPFQFQIPENIPSSYEGTSYGVTAYVRYQLKGTIDKPWKFDHTTKRPFTVVGVLDLNRISNARVGHTFILQRAKVICHFKRWT